MNIPKRHVPISLAEVAPELRERTRRMPPIPISTALGRWIIRNVLKLVPDKQSEGVKFEKRTIPNGPELRIYTPEEPLSGAGLLWIHGGGLVIGSAKQDNRFCAETARQLSIVVISTEYRLAPDFPFPAALDDCHAAWTWLQAATAELRVDPARVAIGGQSAGGGLAASLVQRLHDAGGVQPAAQWLFCPMLDDRTAARHELDGVNHFIWNNRNNRVGWRAYLGIEPGAEQVPAYAVPARRESMTGLPPAWIGSGDIELFFEENQAYAERLEAAGVNCTFDVVAGAPHGFESLASNTTMAQAYLARSRAWLRQVLSDARTRD